MCRPVAQLGEHRIPNPAVVGSIPARPAIYSFEKPMLEKISRFLKEVRAELAKVTWPTRDELISSTGVVIFFSVAFAVFLGLFDMLFSKIATLMMK